MPRNSEPIRRLIVGPDWSSWVVIAVIVLLICGLVFYWISLGAV